MNSHVFERRDSSKTMPSRWIVSQIGGVLAAVVFRAALFMEPLCDDPIFVDGFGSDPETIEIHRPYFSDGQT
jgi:hypothetical protein